MKYFLFQLIKLIVFTCAFCCSVKASILEGTEYVRIQDKFGETACTANDTHAGLSSCLQNKLELSDKLLNEVYLQVMKLCSEDIPSCSKELLSAQRAWIVFRNASCKLETKQSYGGSAYNDYLTNCLIGYTRERTQYLKQFLANP
jgi:uncharacterized protein YecT (DUF1311 family)